MPGSLPDLFRSIIRQNNKQVYVKQVFFHKTYLSYKEKKVPPGGFFSFFACMAAVFFLTGCFRENAAESKMPSLEEKNIRRVKKMEDMRLLRLLLVEKEKYLPSAALFTVPVCIRAGPQI